MMELVIPILVFLTVVLTGSGIVLAVASRRRSLLPRLGSASAGEAGVEVSGQSPVVRVASGLGRTLSLGRFSARLRAQLARAGYYRDSAAATYLGAKLILLVVGAAGIALVVVPFAMPVAIKVYLAGLAGACLFFVPNLLVRLKRRRRLGEIRRHLPDVIDLLEICVSAGMGLDMAWNAVSQEIREVCPTLADEMALVNLEVQLGATRTQAMRNMAARTGAEELSSLVALLVQSERFGTSVGEALRVFAGSSREERSARAEVAAEKMAVKLLFPLIFFILPVMLIVAVGPAVIALYEALMTA